MIYKVKTIKSTKWLPYIINPIVSVYDPKGWSATISLREYLEICHCKKK